MTKEEFILAVEDWYLTGNEDSITFLGRLYDEVTQPHWISVDDELPKEKGLIIIMSFYLSSGEVEMFKYEGESAKVLKDWYHITHWMPLPQPPKKGGEE